MRSNKMGIRRGLALAPWLLLLLAVADWFALRSGNAAHPPGYLAALVGLAAIGFAWRFATLLGRLAGLASAKTRTAAELVLVVGVVVALVAGSANWLLGLQGFVILNEREAVRLHEGDQLQEFVAGPLARIDEMGYFLALNELDLVAEGSGFVPVSLLDVWRGQGEKRRLEVSPRTAASHGRLRFHQGAFGFAPRIVILEGTEERFDRVVPFVSERKGRSGISFSGRFTVEESDLEVDGQVDFASLDEGMRGHASLLLTVWHQGEPIGRGRLLPGEFADLDRGFRLGFAGLEQWSEIVISRRNYGSWVRGGAVLALLGAVLLALAAWRSR